MNIPATLIALPVFNQSFFHVLHKLIHKGGKNGDDKKRHEDEGKIKHLRNSPTMTPTQDRPTFTFKVEMMAGKDAGKMASANFCVFVAPNVSSTFK